MGKINLLSFEVANLIAAGEVVDRPASAIKELMENSIDAGAKHITVEIQNGGITFMRVSDDGCGMEPEDLPLCIRRHATSKIKNAEDLDGIVTLGFRGEALAAISAVSDMRIISRTDNNVLGTALYVNCGEVTDTVEQGCPVGTTVIAENLFANVPARRKFLKKDVTETAAVCANVERVALSHPEIAFRLICDGQMKLETSGDGNLKNAIYSVFGRDFATRLIEVNGDIEGITVSGFVGRSDNVKGNRNAQHFYINNRYIKSKTATAALEQAFVSYLPPEKFPVCVLFVSLNPQRVDVNVHPAKLEVKFSNEKPVFEAIYYSVKQALEQNTNRPQVTVKGASQSNTGVYGKTATGIKMSQAFAPVGREESLKKRQQTIDIFPTSGEKKPPQEHISAQQYVETYLKQIKPQKGDHDGENTDMDPAHGIPEFKEGKPLQIRCDTEPERSEFKSGKPVSGEYTDTPDEPAMNTAVTGSEYSEGEGDSSQETATKLTKNRGSEQKNGDEPIQSAAPVTEKPRSEQKSGDESIQSAVPITDNPDAEQKSSASDWRMVGEVFNSYIIVETGEKILLIDKHAAHERIIFENLKRNMYSAHVSSQILTFPVEVMLMSDEVAAIEEYRQEIEAVGFGFDTKKNTVYVNMIPSGIEPGAAADMLSAMAGRFVSGTGNANITRNIVFEKALYQASCKAAIKAGRVYATENCQWIVDQLKSIPDVTFCPHGRPVAMELSKKNVDHQFERT